MWVTCVNNKGYLASLQIGETYQMLPDAKAEVHEMIRVVDEGGEDYTYPLEYFKKYEDPSK